MKAAVWYGRNDLRVEEVDRHRIAPGKVVIKVNCCGICGTDLHEFAAGPIFIPATEPHPMTGAMAPVVLGHEFSGDVVEIGQGVTCVKVGDRVCVEPIISCGHCAACTAGQYNLCDTIAFHGISSPDDGAFADYTMADEKMVFPIPGTMSYEQGAMVEPAAMVVQAVRRSDLAVGDRVAVFGAGPIGLLLVQAARAAGASEIIAVETSLARRTHALKLGADHAIDPAKENTAEAISRLTDGGVAIAFEATGVAAALSDAIESTKFDGQVVVVSVWEGGAEITPNSFVFRERKMLGILGNCGTFPETIRLIDAGVLAVEALITKSIALNDIVEGGFRELLESKDHVKILVRPEG